MNGPEITAALLDQMSAIAKEEARKLDVFRGLDDMQMKDLLELMQEPVRAVHSCISKGQLIKLCKQLLAQNLALQMQLKNAEGNKK